MRITSQFIRQRATGPLQILEYLDLSNANIECIERLTPCRKLQYLKLHGNDIQDVSNLNCCPYLWSINLSCNKIQCLDGLSKFLCLGTLILSNNDLSWPELVKIQHIHILNLSLHGNPQLEKDNYYRIHVIDCLPSVWTLDGRIITSAERIQVKNFFQDSALTDHPVRRKLTREWFITSAMKNIEVTGLFGPKATALMTKFPVSAVHNIEMDRKRLEYVACNLQDDLIIEQKATKKKNQYVKNKSTFLEEILTARCEEKEKCNMLLLLLVASLEFRLPTHLMQETLKTAKLQKLGKFYSMDLFLLPRDVRCKVVSVLLSAVKIDKDNKENGGLYDKLYLCLFFMVSDLTRLSQTTNKDSQKTANYQTLYQEYKGLLAAEVVQLLCIVPALYEYLEGEVGVMNLIITATGDKNISYAISHMLEKPTEEKEYSKVLQDISDLITVKIQEQMLIMSNKSPRQAQGDVIINKMKHLPMKRLNTSIQRSEYHAKGVSSPEHLKTKVNMNQHSSAPQLGDFILVGPQTLGKVISLPQSDIVLIAMDTVPVSNGAMASKLKTSDDHYTYININHLTWDPSCGFWKPNGTIGDSQRQEKDYQRFTLQTVEDFQQELANKASQSDLSLRPNSPNVPLANTNQPGTYKPTEPLIFSPRKHTTTSTEKLHKFCKTPRPMSSVLKEKLDLKMDFSKTRAKSARTCQVFQTEIDEKHQIESYKNIENSTNCTVFVSPRTNTDQIEAMVTTIVEDCIEKTVNDLILENVTPENEAMVMSIVDECVDKADPLVTPEEAIKPNHIDRPARPTSSKAHLHHHHRRLNLSSEKLGHITSKASSSTTVNIETKSEMSSALNINIPVPQFELEESETARSNRLESQHKQSHHLKKHPKLYKSSRPSYDRSRPFSAVEAYRTFLTQPPGSRYKNRPSSGYTSDFQRARTEAWKFSPRNVSDKETTPPQRPTSPVSNNQTKAIIRVHVTKANNWLGGGRDLHQEMTKSRPKSGHTPGWKQGLPPGFKRPKSSIIFKNRKTETSTYMPQSSVMYSLGYTNGTSVSELSNLHVADYKSLHQQLGLSRKLDLLPTQTEDTEYATDIVYR